MVMHQSLILVLGALITLSLARGETTPPAPCGPVPSARQLAWEDDEIYGFAHFSPNTFTNREWGNGDEPESVFNPTDFNPTQIAQAFKAGGIKGIILTAKHHDGFCLWPSAFTKHSVKNSPWLGGKGDVVKALSTACREQGLKFGIYLSPWDRNHAEYGRPGYQAYYKAQLKELLSNYGPIFELWFDGANGGTGYYGGAREKRSVNTTAYYEWPDAWLSIIRNLQPGCVVHSDFGPDNRWCGNEHGELAQPCWATLLNRDLTFAVEGKYPRVKFGEHPGDFWCPAEADVSIRPGWFYHSDQDAKVKSPETIFNLYLSSVGRGGNLLLNVPPDRRGQITDQDIRALTGFKRILDQTFAVNLAAQGVAAASNTRGNDPHFSAALALDGNKTTYWATNDNVKTASLTVTWPHPVTYDLVDIREYIQLGQRVERYSIQHLDNKGAWVVDASGQSIGHRSLTRLKPVTTTQARLVIEAAAACPCISEFGVFTIAGL